MTAGPAKASAVRAPPGPPASAASARPVVRPVSDDRSGAGAIAAGVVIVSCRRIASSGSAEAFTAKCSTGYRVRIAVLEVNGSLCSQGYILMRQACYAAQPAGRQIEVVRPGRSLQAKAPSW